MSALRASASACLPFRVLQPPRSQVTQSLHDVQIGARCLQNPGENRHIGLGFPRLLRQESAFAEILGISRPCKSLTRELKLLEPRRVQPRQRTGCFHHEFFELRIRGTHRTLLDWHLADLSTIGPQPCQPSTSNQSPGKPPPKPAHYRSRQPEQPAPQLPCRREHPRPTPPAKPRSPRC